MTASYVRPTAPSRTTAQCVGRRGNKLQFIMIKAWMAGKGFLDKGYTPVAGIWDDEQQMFAAARPCAFGPHGTTTSAWATPWMRKRGYWRLASAGPQAYLGHIALRLARQPDDGQGYNGSLHHRRRVCSNLVRTMQFSNAPGQQKFADDPTWQRLPAARTTPQYSLSWQEHQVRARTHMTSC